MVLDSEYKAFTRAITYYPLNQAISRNITNCNTFIELRHTIESLKIITCALVAQLDRVSGFELEGCRFESCQARHFFAHEHSRL